MTSIQSEKRIRLGRILLDLRRRVGISGRELSRRTGIPQSHISKFESGRLSPTREHITKISQALKLPREERLRISSWSRLLSYDFSPFLLHSETQLSENQRLIKDIESTTTTLRAFQCYVVPGLLQSPLYARAIFETAMDAPSGVSAGTVNKAIERRLNRQLVLEKPDKHFQFAIHEMALLNRLGSKPVMIEQLEHLIELNRTGTAGLSLIPVTTYWKGELPTTSFDIFDRDLVLIESQGGLLYLWMEEIVERYSRMFDEIWLRGVTGIRLEQELLRIMKDLCN